MVRYPGMESSLSSVPPVWPSPRPEIIGTMPPQAATTRASTRLTLSPRPRGNASWCARSSAWPSRWRRMISRASMLLAVRNPDVLDMRRGAQELAPFALAAVEPVALVPRGPGALHVRGRGELHRLHALASAAIPHRLDVVVLREHLCEHVLAARDDVDHAAREVRGLEDAVEIRRREGIALRGDDDRRVAGRDRGRHHREHAEQWIPLVAGDADHADGVVHRDRDAPDRHAVHGAVVLVTPCY